MSRSNEVAEIAERMSKLLGRPVTGSSLYLDDIIEVLESLDARILELESQIE
jgi:hypothetical protein